MFGLVFMKFRKLRSPYQENKKLDLHRSLIFSMFDTFTAGAVFCNPPRNADDEFIRHAEATSKMPMAYILVISYPFRNADDEITRHSGGFGFFFISTLRLIFTLISVHFVILVIFLPYLLNLF